MTKRTLRSRVFPWEFKEAFQRYPLWRVVLTDGRPVQRASVRRIRTKGTADLHLPCTLVFGGDSGLTSEARK